MRKRTVIFIILVFIIVLTSSLAYEGKIHRKLNERAIDPSNSFADQVLKQQLGISNGIEIELSKGDVPKIIKEWVAFGGEAEDYGKKRGSSQEFVG